MCQRYVQLRSIISDKMREEKILPLNQSKDQTKSIQATFILSWHTSSSHCYPLLNTQLSNLPRPLPPHPHTPCTSNKSPSKDSSPTAKLLSLMTSPLTMLLSLALMVQENLISSRWVFFPFSFATLLCSVSSLSCSLGVASLCVFFLLRWGPVLLTFLVSRFFFFFFYRQFSLYFATRSSTSSERRNVSNYCTRFVVLMLVTGSS